MPKRRQPDESIVKEIEEAVNAIPSLVTRQSSQQPKHEQMYYSAPKHASFLLWFGVATVSVFIMGLWVINASSIVQDVMTAQDTDEQKLLSNVRSEFDVVLDTLQQTEAEEAVSRALSTAAKQDNSKTRSDEEDVREALRVLAASASTTQEEQQE